jgi:hypothetical protein
MTAPVAALTASTIATMIFQELMKSGLGDLAKN